MTASDFDGHRERRQQLLDRVVALQLEVKSSGDGGAKEALVEARAALQRFDAETIAQRHNSGLRRAS